LSFEKTRRPKGWPTYELTFIATYKGDEKITYTEKVFSIKFYEDNVIGFQKKLQYKEKYYKIQNKEFDIKKIIEELQ
jgi:hypothetical protein